MHNSSLIPALVLPQYWDFSDSQTVLDIGGGYGRLCLSLVTQYPRLQTILFDLPAVCEKATALLAQQPASITTRIQVHPGDFFRDPLPDTADTIVMMRVAHDWPRAQVTALFRKAYAALPHGGRLLVYETFKDSASRPGAAALISLLLLLISPGGECRPFAEVATLLQSVGFSRIERIPTVYCYSLVVAEKD
jgi:demethylspheroidene O-methyltransferase